MQNLVEKGEKNDNIMLEYKCPHCNKLLFRYSQSQILENIEIKCGRCKNIIYIK